MAIRTVGIGTNSGYISIHETFTKSDLEQLLEHKNIGFDRIQTEEMLDKQSFLLLNEYFLKYPEIGFRWYNLIDNGDLSNLKYLTAVSILTIESGYKRQITNLSVLSGLNNLRILTIHAEMLTDHSFLETITPELAHLWLGTKSATFDLTALKKFQKLRRLSLHKCKKNIEIITELPALYELTLRGITLNSLKFINDIKSLRVLKVKLGSTNCFSDLNGNMAIIALELFKISKLANLDFLKDTHSVRVLKVRELMNVVSIPDLKGHVNLRHIELDNMKNLTDFSGLVNAPSLRSVSAVVCPPKLELDDIRPILEVECLKQCCFYSSSARKNVEINNLILAYGKLNERYNGEVRELLYREWSSRF